MHLDLWDHIVHWRVLVVLRHVALVECSRLMGELVRGKGLRMLGLHAKRIDILEVMRPQSMGIETMEMVGRRDLAGMKGTFGGRKR